MRKILVTAYAVNPYKGSEEGTGWNLISQIAEDNQVLAITRRNNAVDINKYMGEHQEACLKNIEFKYFDLPLWMIWWKKGPLLSALYFYIWQFCVAIWVQSKNVEFDIAHSLNFHSNWTPSFLWILGKPFVWGPVGNHPLIPRQYILPVYGLKAYLKDRMLWLVKLGFWNLDPFLYFCKRRATKVFCVNSQVSAVLRLPKNKIVFMPAVASETAMLAPALTANSAAVPGSKNPTLFKVISVGRFVPLKGFDLAIKAFAEFYHRLPPAQQLSAHCLIIGKGPEKKLMQQIIGEAGLGNVITIKEWMPRSEVISEFKNASVFLFPSHEGAGMVVAEALSYGVPVVCLDNYGPGEYVHPESQLKVPHADYDKTVEQLAEKLVRLREDHAFADAEKELALKRFEQLFRWPVKRAIINEVYNASFEVGIDPYAQITLVK